MLLLPRAGAPQLLQQSDEALLRKRLAARAGSEVEGWAGPCALSAELLAQQTLPYDQGLFDFVGAAERILGRTLGQLHELPAAPWEETAPALRRGQIQARKGAPVRKAERKAARNHAKAFERTDEWQRFVDLYRRFVVEWVAPQFEPDFGAEPLLYQAKPILRVVMPGSVAPTRLHCDADYYHDSNELNFWVPLTDVWGSNTLWSESSPGAGDYAPFEAGAGQAVRFYGNRCRHYTLPNDTGGTRVSFDFRVIPRPLFVPPAERGGLAAVVSTLSRHALDGPAASPRGYYALAWPEGS